LCGKVTISAQIECIFGSPSEYVGVKTLMLIENMKAYGASTPDLNHDPLDNVTM
jgi:hypothetical protein